MYVQSMVMTMNNTFNVLGSDINFSVQEGKITGDEFLIKISVQSWDSREIISKHIGGECDNVFTFCAPDTEFIWVKVTKEKFEELTFAVQKDSEGDK